MKLVFLNFVIVFLINDTLAQDIDCGDPRFTICPENSLEVSCDNGQLKCVHPMFPGLFTKKQASVEHANNVLNDILKASATKKLKILSEVSSCEHFDESSLYGDESPVNIPYCSRMSCDTNNKKLNKEKELCHREPGCYFDEELHYLREAFGDDVLSGVPVCHLAIRNLDFHIRARRIKRLFGWSSFLNNCILERYKKTLFKKSDNCKMVSLMKYLGFYPKQAGWKGVTKWECILIDGCWMEDKCVYPINTNGFVVESKQIPSDQVTKNVHGRPKCQDFHTGSHLEMINSYHRCLMAGCALNEQIDRRYFSIIWLIGNSSTSQIHTELMKEVNLGTVAPNNLEAFLKKAKNSSKNLITPFFYNIPFNQSGLIASALSGGIMNLIGINKPFNAPTDLGTSFTQSPNAGGNIGDQYAGGNIGNPLWPNANPTPNRQTDENQESSFPDFTFGVEVGKTSDNEPNNTDKTNAGGFISGENINLPPPNDNIFPPFPSSDENFGLKLDGSMDAFPDLSLFGFLGGCGFGLGRPCPPENFITHPERIITSKLCPFKEPKLQFPFPQLKGSFVGCCDVNPCFIKSEPGEVRRSGVSWYYTQWTSWSECSATCGEGTKRRWRNCITHDDLNCSEDVDQTEVCMAKECTGWANWQGWDACSKSCGSGISRRMRNCLPNVGVSVCGIEDAKKDFETKFCNTMPCVERFGLWQGWHGTCDPCGRKRIRRRYCLLFAECREDELMEEEKCEHQCGKWSKFGEATKCTMNEEGNACFITRYRTCSAKKCKGENVERTRCVCVPPTRDPSDN